MSKPSPITSADKSSEGRGHVALVTGASAGIGKAFARLLAAKGYDVVPVARRLDNLNHLKEELESQWGVNVHVLQADLTIHEEPERIACELAKRGLKVDFLVNNAGYTLMGNFTDKPWRENENYLRVLGLSTIELTYRLLPSMIGQGWGRIINVCSIAAAMQFSPTSVLYAGTKSLIQKFSEGIADEYQHNGIRSTASLPGITATEIFQAGGYQEYINKNKGAQLTMKQPEDVAREAYAAVMSDKRTVVHGWLNRLVVALLLHLPIALRRKLAVAMTGAIEIE